MDTSFLPFALELGCCPSSHQSIVQLNLYDLHQTVLELCSYILISLCKFCESHLTSLCWLLNRHPEALHLQLTQLHDQKYHVCYILLPSLVV